MDRKWTNILRQDYLTTQMKEILLKAKKMGNKNKVAFVWIKDSDVFIKRNPDEDRKK